MNMSDVRKHTISAETLEIKAEENLQIHKAMNRL